jgi:hypothetical protein
VGFDSPEYFGSKSVQLRKAVFAAAAVNGNILHFSIYECVKT